jgi:hypothetical protein
MADTPAAIPAVTHFDVCESDAGCLPETDPYVTSDAGLALDSLAHLMADWSNSHDDPGAEQEDTAYAVGAAETCCGCPPRGTSAEHSDALARLSEGRNVCETAGQREFEIQVCRQHDCLKYCPSGHCGIVTAVSDPDAWCWCCGAAYVLSESCPWLR